MARKKLVRRKFSEAQKLKVLNQLAKTNLSIAAFSKKVGISTGQLYNWQKEFKNTKQTKKARKRGGPYTPEERKQAVENF